MSFAMLKIGGIEIPFQVYAAEQGFGPLEGSTVLRKLNGAGVKQTHWRKLVVNVSGSGFVPPALAGIDWTQPVEFACITRRSIGSATVSATIPSARRSDISPPVEAFAVVNGYLVPTAVVVTVDTAVATAVAGASGYQFHYYPKVNCFSQGPREGFNYAQASASWSIEAEEV